MIVPRIFRPQALVPALLLLVAPLVVHAQGDAVGTPRNTIVFERIFGIPRQIAPERVAEVKALPEGGKLELDTNGDGKINEIWYIDNDYRHDKEIILVRAVDEDGDYAETGRMDLDSDLYFFDWDADGYIDVVIDYVDDDGDNDLDQMGLFYNKNWRDGKDDMTVWWAMDIGDDNLLWYDVNGTYYQPLCQWRTHFSGDELFYQFRLTVDDEKWVNVWEDPFAFYDPDGDLASEVVVRISAVGDAVKNLRYSIDADDDAYGRDTHNYDFSVTALPPEEGLSTEGWHSEVLTIRGVETLPVLSWEKTKEFGQQAKWGKAMLTWDEINSNTDENPAQDPHERWEGILNAKSKHGDFEQVGGPPSSPFNKRVEVSASPASPLVLYFDEVDQRFHLLGADYGYMDVDYNLDGVVDGAQTWKDTDGDGKLDVREIDVNNDGVVDIVQTLKPGDRAFALEFEEFPDTYKPAIARALAEGQAFIDTAVGVLGETPADVQEIIDFYAGPLADHHPETEIGLRIRNTPAGARFYVELVRDRLFARLKREHADKPYMEEVVRRYEAGDYAGATAHLQNRASVIPYPAGTAPLARNGQTYTRRIPVTVSASVTDEAPQFYQDYPVSIPVADLRATDPDFNPANSVVVDGEFWLDWRAVPHQVDNWRHAGHLSNSAKSDTARRGRSELALGSEWLVGNNDSAAGFTGLSFNGIRTSGGTMELSFVADIEPGESRLFYVYYNPESAQALAYPQLTNAVLDNPAHVAWESDAGAFRFYTGQFDFFGKQVQLLPREARLIYPLIDVNYHAQQDWGIDALHVGKTSGLGGVTVYRGDAAYPVQSPAGQGEVAFEYTVLGSGPVRAAVEMIATNVFSDQPEAPVSVRAFIYAGRAESEINVLLPEGLEDASIAAGLMRLEGGEGFARAGALGEWGYHGDDIGEIGLALAWKPAPATGAVLGFDAERHVVTGQGDRATYWIRGGWRRGMQYPVSYDHQNWEREIREWAAALHADLAVSVGEKQDTKRH